MYILLTERDLDNKVNQLVNSVGLASNCHARGCEFKTYNCS